LRLLDASGLIAFLLDEPAAEEVGALVADGSEQAAINAVNLAEVIDRLVRVGGRDRASVLESLLWVRAGGLDVLFADDVIAEVAGQLRARHYDRRTAALSIADCVALATARREGATLATTDTALARIARVEDVAVVALPDSRGHRP